MPRVRPKVSSEHMAFLERQAVTRDVIEDAGIFTVYDADTLPREMRLWPGRDGYPGLAFPYRGFNGGSLIQLRPEKPIKFRDGHVAKYVFPKDCEMILNVHPWMDEQVDDPDVPLVIIEGTKQYLAAVSALGKDSEYALVGMPGCYGWKQHQKPLPDMSALADVLVGRTAYLCFDADWKHNRDVYNAAKALSDQLRLYGVASVYYIAVPGQGTEGLDDVLANVPDKREALLGLIGRAETKLPPRPPAKSKAGEFTDESGAVLRQKVVDRILTEHALALAPDHTVMIYNDGVYQLDTSALKMTKIIADLLGDRFTVNERNNITSMLAAELADLDRVIPPNPISPWVNLKNGMLDLETLELHDHDPKLYSITQLPIKWNPKAACPTYDKWLSDVCGDDQADLLHEVLAQMLTPQAKPTKALFLFGPSRSGKSTALRIARKIAGEGNTASETLHDLSRDRFASASLYGKVLNSAADLSARRVEDLSTFKMLTGDDSISAQFKGKQKFEFINKAVIAFSSNHPPTVNEESNAYRVRLAKIAFDKSFEGAEDPSIEARILAVELPGVLARIARAGQARSASGGSWTRERPSATAAFEQYSDAVARWLSEEKTVVTHRPAPTDDSPGMTEIIAEGQTVPEKLCSKLEDLHADFKEWAYENGEESIGKKTLSNRLTSIDGVLHVRTGPKFLRRLNIIDKQDDDHDPSSLSTSTVTTVKTVKTEDELIPGEDETSDEGAPSPLKGGVESDVKPVLTVTVASDHGTLGDLELPSVEADVDLLEQWVYEEIVKDPAKATETKIREALGISSTEYHGARDLLINIGVVARRKGRGFDLLAPLVARRSELVEQTRWLPLTPYTQLYDALPTPYCIDCGQAKPGTPNDVMLPLCPDCLIPFDLEDEA